MKKITEDWLKSAESDLSIIERIIDLENLSHQVAFHAQQAVEKSFKAIIEEYELGFVRTHSLTVLSGIVEEKFSCGNDIDMLILLNQLYIDSRYPGELGLLPDGIPSSTQAIKFRDFAKELFNEVKHFLSKPPTQ